MSQRTKCRNLQRAIIQSKIGQMYRKSIELDLQLFKRKQYKKVQIPHFIQGKFQKKSGKLNVNMTIISGTIILIWMNAPVNSLAIIKSDTYIHQKC